MKKVITYTKLLKNIEEKNWRVINTRGNLQVVRNEHGKFIIYEVVN